ncbi:MAG: aminotransferase class V-fold PLP-dependent enzyme [Muribaculaceae bacterium]
MLDVEKIRKEFPILSRKVYGHDLIYFDNAATAQVPKSVIDAITRTYTKHHANVHRGVHCLSQEATDEQELTRREVAAWIGAPDPAEVIFTRGTTEGINLVASCLTQGMEAGDEIVLTVMEHHSNIVPWQLAAGRRGLVIKVVPINADGSLDIDALRALVTDRTRIVTVAHVSNVLGTVNPVAEIAGIAHSHGALCLVDGAQGAPHYKIDVNALGCDFYVFSGHKIYGPTGVGVLWGRRELLEQMPPYQGGGEMIDHVRLPMGTTFAELPFKFEAGTPDYACIPALREAIKFMDGVGIDAIEAHETALYRHITERIARELPQVRIFGTAPGKCPVLSFLIGDAHSYDTGMLLDKLGIAVRTGHHCAQPLMEVLGVSGTVRASMGVYNTMDEADRFVDALVRITPILS